VGKASDSPDGDLVEKGAAAERLRIKFPTSQGARNVFTCTSSGGGICANGTTFSASVPSTVFSAGGTGYPPDNTDITAADLGAYLQYPVNSLQAAINADAVTSTVTTVLGAIPNPSWSTGSQVVRISGALPNAFNGDVTISGYTENSPSAGLTTFTYQINSVLPGNIAAVQMPLTPTPVPHQLRTGDFVTVSGASPVVYNVTNAPISFINPNRFSYTLSGNATGAATLGTVRGSKAVNMLVGQRNSSTAFAVIPAHGYSGVSVTGFSMSGSTYSFFNSVLGGTATALSGTADTLSYTTGTLITGTGNAVLVTSNTHELQSGDLITVTGGVPAGYNVTDAVVTKIDANRFTYPASAAISGANTGTLTITAKRRVNLSASDNPARSLTNGSSGATRGTATGNTGTFVHNLSTAWKVDVSCANPTAGSATGFNTASGGVAVASVPTSTSFTYTISGVNAGTTATGTTSGTDYTGAACTGSVLVQFRKTSFTTPTAVDAIMDNGSGILATTVLSPSSVAVRSSATGSITAGRPTDVDATQRASIINWVRGQDNKEDENINSSSTDIRASVHGDVLHSRPAVVNYNRFGDDNDVYAFYGSNDGMLHVLKAGAASSEAGLSAGDERWSFIPREFFSKLKRLRDNTPAISATNPKPYLADGPITVYQKDVNGDGQLTPGGGDKVYLYVGFHRGGQFLYALDVTDPAAPKLLWRKTNADPGYAELGQTWSSPTVTKLAANIGNASNPENVVLIFGAGYDPNVDDVNPCVLQSVGPNSVTLKPVGSGTVDYSTPIGSCTINNPTGTATTRNRTMGRGVLIVDAFNGNVVWQVGPNPSGATLGNVAVSAMTCSIPSDVTPIDFDRNGTADFIYVGDTCANLWRIDVADTNVGNWQVNKLASLAGSDVPNARKFLFPPDAVASSDNNGSFIAVLVGSGDRQHAFDTTIQDRFYMIKDRTSAANPAPATITDGQLFDATTSNGANDFGWKMGFGLGEKDVGGTVTLGGTTFFNTNQPSATAGGGACANNLGVSRQYAIDFATAGATADLNSSGGTVYTTEDRSKMVRGGGFLPSPVPATVEIGGQKFQVVISGTQVQQPPGATLDTRLRTYWYREYE
jgi:Tfp pilus tip-associated adhesin PilY1